MEERAEFQEVIAGLVEESANELVEDVVVAAIPVSNYVVDFRPDKEAEVFPGSVYLFRKT